MYSVLTKVLECQNSDPNHVCNGRCFSGHSVTAKGIKRSAQKSISHEDYKTVLETSSTTMTTSRAIRSYKHKIYSIISTKRGLSAFDDKKYIMESGIDTLSYGHYKLQKIAWKTLLWLILFYIELLNHWWEGIMVDSSSSRLAPLVI